jgi:superoxide reductase
MKQLTPEDEPKAVFAACDGKPLAVYELCNLHGLWVKEL